MLGTHREHRCPFRSIPSQGKTLRRVCSVHQCMSSAAATDSKSSSRNFSMNGGVCHEHWVDPIEVGPPASVLLPTALPLATYGEAPAQRSVIPNLRRSPPPKPLQDFPNGCCRCAP